MPEAASAALHREVEAFLYDEAELQDTGSHRAWLDLLTDDMHYTMPVRVTRERGAESDLIEDMHHVDDDRVALEMRIMRLATEYAWAEDPPSRTRHYVTNVRVRRVEGDELTVKSNVLLYRTRGDLPTYDLISCEREDVLRRVEGELRLARRRVVLDQSTVLTHNLAVLP